MGRPRPTQDPAQGATPAMPRTPLNLAATLLLGVVAVGLVTDGRFTAAPARPRVTAAAPPAGGWGPAREDHPADQKLPEGWGSGRAAEIADLLHKQYKWDDIDEDRNTALELLLD